MPVAKDMADIYIILLFRYSRKILWLDLERTHNNPRVNVQYFVDTVEELGG